MGKIVAIGGGEIGRPGTKIETQRIDRRIIELSGKSKPNLLFLPTASRDNEGYVDVVKNYFGKKLGVKVRTLYLHDPKKRPKNISSEILGTDIVYVGGGDTLTMIKLWRKLGVDKALLDAYKKGVVLSGLSAGALCWANYALSDARAFQNTDNKEPMRVKCLGLINITLTPHQLREPSRLYEMAKFIEKNYGIGLVLDDCAALELVDDKYRIVHSKTHSGAYKVYKKNKKIMIRRIVASSEYEMLENLYSKKF